MRHHFSSKLTRRGLRLGVFTAVAVSALLLSAAPAEAGNRHRHRGQRHGHHACVQGSHGHGARFDVPVRIYAGGYPRYREYYRGAAYYRPHRHEHAVYYFPVRVATGVIYQPHYYCGAELYAGHDRAHGYVSYAGPRVQVGVRF